ncbi:hypothetical protein TNCV_285781 [Trichonephila clavipes]|nr:hypothetical protein TNCV_285781 [Trichonephila clavipes]
MKLGVQEKKNFGFLTIWCTIKDLGKTSLSGIEKDESTTTKGHLDMPPPTLGSSPGIQFAVQLSVIKRLSHVDQFSRSQLFHRKPKHSLTYMAITQVIHHQDENPTRKLEAPLVLQ